MYVYVYVYELRLRHVHAKLNTSRKVVGATRGINYTETQAWTSVSLNGKSITLKVLLISGPFEQGPPAPCVRHGIIVRNDIHDYAG